MSFKVYHDTNSSACQEARSYAKSKGYDLDNDEVWQTFATTPRPRDGQTNRFNLAVYKDGVLQKRKGFAVQIFCNDAKHKRFFELNCYVS